jgi:hypothetical protein
VLILFLPKDADDNAPDAAALQLELRRMGVQRSNPQMALPVAATSAAPPVEGRAV